MQLRNLLTVTPISASNTIMNVASLNHPAISAITNSLLPSQSLLLRTALPILLATSNSNSVSEHPPNGGNNVRNDCSSSETSSEISSTALTTPKMDKIIKLFQLPRPRAIIFMTVAMALHFGGYEFARSGMTALFTSNDVGFSNPGAFPFAVGMVSPCSVLLLMAYGNILQTLGPRVALRRTTLFSALFLGGSALALYLSRNALYAGSGGNGLHLVCQAIVALAFVYQNAYAHLLYTQQWSFLSSIMTPDEGSVWFAAIAGVSSIISTFTGALVKPLVGAVGLIGTVACTSLFLSVSLLTADRAYHLAENHGFDPAASIRKKLNDKQQNKSMQQSVDKKNQNFFRKAKDLFQQVPTLGMLFGEVLSFQALSVILNLALITQLKITIPSDVDRAAWLGQFFSATNAVSGILQFIVIPSFMKRIEPATIWRFMPTIPLACSIFQSFQGTSPMLWILGLSFFATKTMDYSIRGVVNEMIYQPLDFDSRYLGKEIIGVFGSRFGKSGISLILSGLTYVFPTFGIYHLSKLSVVASVGWSSTCWWLARIVPRKAEAQEAFLEQRREIVVPLTELKSENQINKEKNA